MRPTTYRSPTSSAETTQPTCSAWPAACVTATRPPRTLAASSLRLRGSRPDQLRPPPARPGAAQRRRRARQHRRRRARHPPHVLPAIVVALVISVQFASSLGTNGSSDTGSAGRQHDLSRHRASCGRDLSGARSRAFSRPPAHASAGPAVVVVVTAGCVLPSATPQTSRSCSLTWARCYGNGWAAPRDGGRRRHEGIDIMGVRGQPLRAPFDGIVTRRRVVLPRHRIHGHDHPPRRHQASLIHINDDNPGTADGAAPLARRIPDAVQVGTPVLAGQIAGSWATPATPSVSLTCTSRCASRTAPRSTPVLGADRKSVV